MLLFALPRFRLSAAVAAVSFVALAANTSEAMSLAEYITAICSATFHAAPPHEAPFLSENVGAMTRMIVRHQHL